MHYLDLRGKLFSLNVIYFLVKRFCNILEVQKCVLKKRVGGCQAHWDCRTQ